MHARQDIQVDCFDSEVPEELQFWTPHVKVSSPCEKVAAMAPLPTAQRLNHGLWLEATAFCELLSTKALLRESERRKSAAVRHLVVYAPRCLALALYCLA
jgi:hypothetical protein